MIVVSIKKIVVANDQQKLEFSRTQIEPESVDTRHDFSCYWFTVEKI